MLIRALTLDFYRRSQEMFTRRSVRDIRKMFGVICISIIVILLTVTSYFSGPKSISQSTSLKMVNA